jgi:hypothetical protein
MPMQVIRPSSEAEMVALFLRGELESERFGSRVRSAVAEHLLLEPDLEDERQNAVRSAALTELRGYESREGLFHGFPDDMRWEWAALTPDEVLAVRYIEYDYWVELSGGSRLPLDAAERIRAGITVFRVPNDGFFELADGLATREIPELIVVGNDGTRLVVLEGHARLTAFALRPDALPPALEVLLGRSPRIASWACW